MASGPPKCALEDDGKKWVVEFQTGSKFEQKEITIDAEDHPGVYIFKCENTLINIKGKINSIQMVRCKKTSIAFDDCIASVEVNNCQSVEVEVKGKLPACIVDKTDGFILYLSNNSLETEITTALCTNMNVTIAGEKEGDQPVEIPVPQQFVTKVNPDGTLTTKPSEHV